MTKNYELMYILPSSLTETEAPEHAAKIGGLLNTAQAQITQEVDLGKKKLAYPINHDRYGYYRLVEFTTDSGTIQKLNESLRLSRELLRHLIIEKPVKSEAVLERERALKERLAARRQRPETQVTSEKQIAEPVSTLSAEELDKKLEEIVEETPNI